MTSKTFKLMSVVLVSGLALASQSAFSATTLTYLGAAHGEYQSGYLSYNDGAGGYPDFYGTTSGVSPQHDARKNVYVGGFSMRNETTHQPITAWCVDIFDWLHSASYNDGVSSNINNIDKLQQLVNRNFSKVNNATTSAAFQLAVWEIVSETPGSTSFSLGSGRFTASNSGTGIRDLSNAITLANDWLGLDEANTGNYKIGYYIYGNGSMPNYTTQNLITMSPVPLPAAGLLMLSALGLGGLATKRRASAKK